MASAAFWRTWNQPPRDSDHLPALDATPIAYLRSWQRQWLSNQVSRHLYLAMLAVYDQSDASCGGSLPEAWHKGGEGA